MRVLITDSDSRQSLAATRSLGRAGHAVINASERHPSIAGSSKYSRGHIACPDVLVKPDDFLRAIVAATSAHSIDVLLPMTEVSTLLLARHRHDLPRSCSLPFAGAEALAAASDKTAVIAMAREMDVPVPNSVACSSREEARAAISALPFPVVLKPARSRVRTASGWISNRVEYAHDRDELQARIDGLSDAAFPLLLQERISGRGIGFFACYDRGSIVASFAHRRIREKPATGGVSVLCESIPVPERAREYGCRLLDRLSWHGVAMVEFKEDTRDGTLKLMEINARFWGSLQLAIHAGVDFPGILVDLPGRSSRRPEPAYRYGVRSRWLLGDVDSLIGLLRAPRSRHPSDVPARSRWRAMGEFLTSGWIDIDYDLMALNDPKPGLLELRRWLTQS